MMQRTPPGNPGREEVQIFRETPNNKQNNKMKYITTVTIRENQVALLFRDGVFARQLEPGKQRFFGAGYEVKIFDARWKEMQLQGQEFLTADKAQLRASALVKYRVTDARLFEGVSDNPLLVIYTAAQLALRDAIGVLGIQPSVFSYDCINPSSAVRSA